MPVSEDESGPARAPSCPGGLLPPAGEGQFTKAGPRGDIRPIGQRCRACGTLAFPRRALCIKCFGRDLETVELARTGAVDGFSVVHQAPPGYAGPVPYVVGTVVLEGGVRMLAYLTGKAPEAWAVGDRVACYEMSFPIAPGAGGEALYYAYRPAGGEDLET